MSGNTEFRNLVEELEDMGVAGVLVLDGVVHYVGQEGGYGVGGYDASADISRLERILGRQYPVDWPTTVIHPEVSQEARETCEDLRSKNHSLLMISGKRGRFVRTTFQGEEVLAYIGFVKADDFDYGKMRTDLVAWISWMIEQPKRGEYSGTFPWAGEGVRLR